MLYHNVQVMGHSLRFIDAGVVVAGALGAVWFGLEPGLRPLSPVLGLSMAVFAGALGLAFMALAERFHIYFARRTEAIWPEIFGLAEVAFYATALACVLTEVLAPALNGSAYLRAVAGGATSLACVRLLMRYTVRRARRRGDDYRVWLIVGHNERAVALAETIVANPHFGIRIEEIVDLAQAGSDTPARKLDRPVPAGIRSRVLANAEAVREIVAARVIDEVVVTLPLRSHYDEVRRLLDICCEAGISVKLGPQLFKQEGFFTEVSHVGSIPMVTHYSGPGNYRLLMVKRVIDLAGSALGLMLMLPLLAVIAAAVKFTSHGPVFFVQTRVGLHGRHFSMFKFRSMVKDAPQLRGDLAQLNERDGCAFKIRNDARVTPLGRWLRKYHLDELPQLWNVLVGDMSLVGPRPLPVAEAFGDEWWQRRRLTMPPGLTCHWQLADDPTMPFRQWMELDMAYIDRWSLWLDFKILFRTFGTVVRGNGW